MPKLEISTVIKRPVEEVFTLSSNPENYPKWFAGSTEVRKTSEGPIGVGATYRTVVIFLGRRIEGEIKVTEYEPNQRCATKSRSAPFPVENQTTFERVNGGTRVTVSTVAEPGGFFKLAEPLLVSMLKRQFEANLTTLKDLMEARAL
jgi:uncharacterized protein YndB with AHSA1/START domain